MRRLVSAEEARRVLLSLVDVIGEEEKVPLDEALGRVLSRNVYAESDVPPHDRATMDGYAVRARDTWHASETHPVSLSLVGAVPIGQIPSVSVGPGQAARIDTGAVLPPGADAVVPLEYCEERDGKVLVYRRVSPGENVQWAGSDIARGELIAQRGTVVTPRVIAALAAAGVGSVWVVRRPRIAVLSIGNELVEVGATLRPGQVYDVNAHTIRALAVSLGAEVKLLGIASDDPEDVASRISDGLKWGDLVVTTGSSSVGQQDILERAIGSIGGEILVHGVRTKPGKPVLIARVRGKPVIGLPGHPTSAYVTFKLYVEPAIRRMLGLRPLRRIPRTACLTRPVITAEGRATFQTLTVKRGLALPLNVISGAVSTVLRADAFIFVDESTRLIPPGQTIHLEPLDDIAGEVDILIVGEFSPTLQQVFVEFAERENLTLRWLKAGRDAALLSVRRGEADVAVVPGVVDNAHVILERKLILVEHARGEVVAAVDINIASSRVRTHQSAAFRLLTGLAGAAVLPDELAELYGLRGREVGREAISVVVSEHFEMRDKLIDFLVTRLRAVSGVSRTCA